MRFDNPQQRLQADLIWAASSVDMMRYESISAAQGLASVANAPVITELTQWLQKSDHYAPLLQLITQRQPRRLGIYFEVLWQYILEHYPGFELIHRNLVVQTNKRTLGEMDFIYFCKSRQRHIHLETAVKFYLGLPTENASQQALWRNWIGPGCIDRLDLKLAKMLDKQIRLSATPEGKTLLQSLGVKDIQREICLKGYFFYPYGSTSAAPKKSHPHHAIGYWLSQTQLHRLPPYSNWRILRKEEWLSPLTLPKQQALLDQQQLEAGISQSFSAHKFPLMIARMSHTNTGLIEQQRFFVTPDNWPQFVAP